MYVFRLLMIWWLSASLAQAATGSWLEQGPVNARLISPVMSITNMDKIPMALELTLQAGWKTYWRVPGAAGAAPKITLDQNWLSTDVQWQLPAPSTFTLLGLQTFGYDKHVVLPFQLSKSVSTDETVVTATASVYVCNEICLAQSLPLSIHFQTGISDNTDWNVAPLYNQYLSRVPKPVSDIAGIATQDDGGFYLEFTLEQPGLKPELFLENQDVYEWSAPLINQQNGVVKVWWQKPEDVPMRAVAPDFIVTYKDSLQAITTVFPLQHQKRPAPSSPALASASEQAGNSTLITLAMMLMLAFIGGMLLNVMPCVLPVLSIKLMSWLQWRDDQPGKIRAHALVSGFGVVSFFWIIATGLIVMKQTGRYIGWGIQFQNPWFLLALFLIMLVFLANLLDRFAIQLPQGLQGKLVKVGEGQSGLLKSYLQGGTATLMATPCSAPFLGTAVAFAFTQSSLTLWLIFSALGFGLAVPYLLLALAPGLINRMPEPGHWMLTVKRILALGLGLTLVWLLFLISKHIYLPGIVLMALTSVLWIVSLYTPITRARPITTLITAMGVAFLSLTFSKSHSEQISNEPLWEPYSQQAVSEHLRQQHTVFLDVTADWCITCKFNKISVLDTDEIQQFFNDHQVVLIQTDWTRPDPAIEALLATYHRSAIPFNVVLSPRARDGIVLPELLTRTAVKQAIIEAE
ncbi:protein-disulfide reductase DsbD family protein [Gynuella sunshinyii]|uniref:Thiol:disulfide interchange protein n=1 Tax=Gynuella sunshinyii YC6258 TaxID=1445510 RepID=A0A0C5W4A6_9GAMM|nr:thioredoxin family protein [Gynuella sunshinyii]AJQ97459.1 thiol:disulfide interchange protein [Gynuella sunshinyii YC6258]